jgi:hypothetical protein
VHASKATGQVRAQEEEQVPQISMSSTNDLKSEVLLVRNLPMIIYHLTTTPRFNCLPGSSKTVRKTLKRLSITTLLSTSTIQGVAVEEIIRIYLQEVLSKGNHHSQVKELKGSS